MTCFNNDLNKCNSSTCSGCSKNKGEIHFPSKTATIDLEAMFRLGWYATIGRDITTLVKRCSKPSCPLMNKVKVEQSEELMFV